MEILRGTRALLLLATVLLISGFVTGEDTFLIGGMVMVLGAAAQAVAFAHTLGFCEHQIQLERTVTPRILRQGSYLEVTTVIHARVPAGFSLQIQENSPAGSAVVRGENGGSLTGPVEGSVTLRYTLRMLARGELPFRGITMTLSNPYYRAHLRISGDRFTDPILTVQPALAFAIEQPLAVTGSREIDRFRAISGQGIRAFRSFRTGDDVRAIDWKLSAKYGRLMLREYMGRASGLPFFVLDLPPALEPAGAAGYERLLASLTAGIESTLREYRRTDLLILSGGRVLRSLSPLHDIRVWYRLQHQLVPGDSYLPLFRFRDLPSIHSFQQRVERSALNRGDDERRFLSRIGHLLSASITRRPRTLLEQQILAVLRQTGERDVMIYSMLSADQSNLHQLISVARSLRLKVHLHHPRGVHPTPSTDLLADTVKVVL